MAKKAKTKTPNLKPGVGREIVAILLATLAILITVAFFNWGGYLLESVFSGLRWLVGLAAYTLPTLLLYLAWRLFKAEEEPLTFSSYLGFILIIMSVSGLSHVGADETTALTVAREGNGGGMLGYAISRVTLALLNPTTASIVYLTSIIIGVVLAANTKFSDIVAALRNWWQSRREDDDFAKVLARPQSKMTVNAKVPLETRRGDTAPVAVREEPEVLITSADPDWTLPSLELLSDKQGKADAGDIEENARHIQETLSSFGIEVAMEEANVGPTVTQYTLRPPSGVKLSKINELGSNLALSLAAPSVRIEAPIPGKSAVGVEVPNRQAATVYMRESLKSDEWQKHKSPLNFVLGQAVSGQVMVADLAGMPHLLIAGATGSGKSVMINTLLLSLLYRNSPSNLKLILVDPKRVELNLYSDIPHLLAPVIIEPEKCISALKWAVAEMERRYNVFAELHKRNIAEYNSVKKEESMPYIVIVIDELADLMMMAAQEVESLIVRLAQKARATGIHLVLATQRPSVNVITGLIKANIPARIAFSTVSQVDSRTILDQVGAEKLLGKGDMLFLSPELSKPKRIQGVFVDEKEVKAVTDFLRDAREPNYNEEVLTQAVKMGSGKMAVGDFDSNDDTLFREAAELVIESGKASASLLQRRLRVGYARAARLLDILEEQGIVSPPDGARPREVLVSSLDFLDDQPSSEV